jgi:hypothetical protein
VQDKQITACTFNETEQVHQLNVEHETEPTYLKVDAHMEKALA